jgi:hypothetical protein
MRTKTLLLAAAGLAAGIASSEAQNVYSQNIVGYVSIPVPATYVLINNPLVNTTSNDLNTIASALPSKASAEVWNGSGYTVCSKSGSGWSPDALVPVGTGFFAKVNSGITTNVFVGNVVANPGTSVTNPVTAVYNLVGSDLPYATDLNDTNGYGLNLSSLPSKASIETWNGSAFTVSSKSGSGWSPDAQLTVGEGFFLKLNSGTSNWIQTLPANP